MRPGPRNLITDVTGLRVGSAEDAGLKSGVSVVTAEAPFTASVAVMGGAPGTRETDLLAPDKTAPGVDALVLSGGSAFGLAAAQGVMEALHAAGRGFAVLSARVPIVPAAILFDLLNGGTKDWRVNPYPELGRRALSSAGEAFALGSHGAGCGAQTAMHKGGLGSASLVLEDGITVGALVAANPMGSATTPSGRHFWAAPFELGGEFGGLGVDPDQGTALPESRKVSAMAGLGNTTIAVVATDAALDKAQCHRMAVAAHDGIGRAILPAHSPMDGDLVFAAATGVRQLEAPALQLAGIGHAASVCLARAIARAVWEATPAPGDTLPTLREELGRV
ncbi:MAG: peptidase S58 family protein [Rhodobacteraceae bacterium]|jgi:L-aminopeptidase/D-esterase-like protein|uniref:D-aminopeptidase n=1 Tax=Salipiger profundus TaxID=1229727 RepID=A0A1U7D2A8_9RHOB|nr:MULTISPECIES: P1 family peptidase [Salipiger]APX22297.1 D-aminopeptidase [Salipiger profundus]MAB05582.1 peptidase S58 family protein [Paracoccaceae bacterium]GGA22174.1 peptidase T4 [Salipiger profundus]SFD67816.1 D-aminopeptidase [Salipiger profundus]